MKIMITVLSLLLTCSTVFAASQSQSDADNINTLYAARVAAMMVDPSTLNLEETIKWNEAVYNVSLSILTVNRLNSRPIENPDILEFNRLDTKNAALLSTLEVGVSSATPRPLSVML